MESILDSVKKMLGIDPDYTAFDTDIIMFTNAVFNILMQMGVGPKTGFSISDNNSKWGDYIEDTSKLEMIKPYIYMKVRIMFDPPQGGSLLEAYNKQISELEWRLNVQVDPGEENINV